VKASALAYTVHINLNFKTQVFSLAAFIVKKKKEDSYESSPFLL
jgi:hypothetical protein